MEKLLVDDEDLLNMILQRIRHIADYGGNPTPPIAKPLRGDIGLCEIRTSLSRDELLRICYFVDRERKRMVLLNWFSKPDGGQHSNKYEGNAGRKTHKEVQEAIDIAVSLKAEYAEKLSHYELFPFT